LEKIILGFKPVTKKLRMKKFSLAAELDLVGGWKGVKPYIRDCLAQYKNS
jgi:hypothetical protein